MLQSLLDGNDFYATIFEMGEEITFLTEPNKTIQYASIAPHRITNTTDGAYWYRGAMTFDSVDQQESLLGEYFTRQTNPGPKHILTAVMPENTTPRMATVYAVECNDKVDIISHYEKSETPNEFGEYDQVPIYLAKDVAVYMTTTLERLDIEAPGNVLNAKFTFSIPAKYSISEHNVLERDGIVWDKVQKKNVPGKIKYRIQSIDASMMDLYKGKPVGILKCLTVEDHR